MARGWRWGNVPIPEAHLLAIALGLGIGAVWPLRFSSGWAVAAGIVLGLLGGASAVWAVLAAGSVDPARPDRPVTTGPYRLSRHPMYVGWTMLYLGLALVLGSGWMLVLFPLLASWIHRETGREEERMIEEFGSAYERYRERVRRYV